MSKRKTKLQTNTMHKLAYREGYSKEELKEQVEEIAQGLKIADYITYKEYSEYVEDVEKWLETAAEGDAYYIDGTKLVYNPQRDVENDETIYRIIQTATNAKGHRSVLIQRAAGMIMTAGIA